MVYQLKAVGSRLQLFSINEGTTGNAESYECLIKFQSADWIGRECFAVFKVGSEHYTKLLKNGRCTIPDKALEKAQAIYLGVYGIKPGDVVDRLSSEWVVLNIKEGAYKSGTTTPAPPEADLWEQYLDQIVSMREHLAPKIVDGYWCLWDEETQQYVKTSNKAIPEKGVDYFTEADVDALGLDEKLDKSDAESVVRTTKPLLEENVIPPTGFTPQPATIYTLGECQTLYLDLRHGTVGDWSQVDFISGEVPTNLTILASGVGMSNHNISPAKNKIYSVFFDFGVLGIENGALQYGWRISYGEYDRYMGGDV